MKNKVQKRLLVAVIGAGMVMSSVWAVQAEMPEDFWEYNLAYDEENNTIYEFDELEVVIPEDWEGRYEVEETEDGLRFYSTAVREYSQKIYPDWKSGELFAIRVSQDYGFLEGINYSYVIGSSDEYIYYLSVEQAEAFAPEDAQSAAEWRELASAREWIEEQASVTQPGEGIVNAEQMEEAAEKHTDNAEVFVGEYIVPDSSDRELTAEDLEGLDANELQMAINEIYARHHRKFVTKDIQKYFESKSWYQGTVEAAKFDASSLSLIENKNIALMIQCMNGNGTDNNTGMNGSLTSTAQNGTSDTGVSAAENGMTLYAVATVNIRSKATTESAIMGVVPQGYAVTATGSVQNGWIPVTYSGIKGYIRQDLLTSSAAGVMNSGSSQQVGAAPVNDAQGTTNLQGESNSQGITDAQGIDYAAMFNSDGTIRGTILSEDFSNGVTILADDGGEYHFKFGKETTYLFGEKGDYVEIQYFGSLNEEPQVQCMLKKASEEALNEGVKSVEGTFITEGNDILTIQTADGASYSFLVGSVAWPHECTTGDVVIVSYRGTLDAPEVISVVKK